jgi:ribosomal protein S27AE
MTERFHCNFCQKLRNNVGGLCDGCGSFVANATYKRQPESTTAVPKCPRCGKRGVSQEEDRYYCISCQAWYETPDQQYLDTRPLQAAIKAEEQQKYDRERKARRHKRGGYGR